MTDVKWDKYSYVCSDCDALTEITTVKNLKEYRGWCSCGSANLLWVSVEDATILPTTTKGNKMETAVEYNPNLLVTYKKIDNNEVSYPTEKVTDIEWALDRAREQSKSYYNMLNKINDLDDMITEWSNPNYTKEEVLAELCEYFGISPTKTVAVKAQVEVLVNIEVPIFEMEDFDASDYLRDNLTIDAYSTDLRVEEWDIEHIEWDVQ
jgi:hypothetical protein